MAFMKKLVLKYILMFIVFAGIALALYFYISATKPIAIEVEPSQKESNPSQGPEAFEPVSILFVGDTMFDRKVEVLLEKNSYNYPFEKIFGLLQNNDFVVGNLEGPIMEKPTQFSLSAMTFAFSSKIIQPLVQNNFKVLSLANNHTSNAHQKGLDETKQLLTEAGISWVGSPSGCSRDYVIKGNLVFLAFNTTFGDCADDEIKEIVKNTKETNPDKFLVVFMHWGNEYQTRSSQPQKDLAHKIIDSGADLIIGSHPHVVQEAEKYKDKMIFYSLGNFVFDQYFSQDVQEGLAVRLETYGDKLLYRVLPLESSVSQPQLMDSTKAEAFLKEYNFESLSGNIATGKACFNENCFYVELAQTPQEQELGLMYRKYMDEDRGMLFVFQNEGKYSFWMKNTFIPLDIVWLNSDKQVVFIAESAQPCTKEVCRNIDPKKNAKYVLELNVGMVQKINLKIGDKLVISD